MKEVASFSVSIVGAPYPNKDGSNRQFEIKLCSPGEAVALLPERKNRYDEHAIAVLSARDTQIGYVSSERAPYLGGLMRDGRILEAIFQEETAWGAIIRIGVDRAPELPQARPKKLSPEADDIGFYPDFIPPDDWD